MLKGIFRGLIDLVYPKICLVCKLKLKNTGSIDNLVCPECWSKIKKNIPPFCRSCGRHLEKPIKNICSACIRKPLHFDRAFSACNYEGALKDLIREFKYKSKDHLGITLSRLMLEFIEEYSLKTEFFDFIIPVPLHQARLREREFNQAKILGRQIALKHNKVLLDDILIRGRNNRTQTDLEDRERFSNVKGIFSINKSGRVKGKNILLIDDVLTSGATCSEAAYTLKDAGANIVFVLTLAN